ncbi:MAG: hypothetical protein HOO88_06070 [Kiritimatiellaceae bacterium]|nr:hypothetical protein [Kiritimatiellaceae bacterium]
MKNHVAILSLFYLLTGGAAVVASGSLNEWTFEVDPAGKTLSEAINSGTESAQFSSGGLGVLAADGVGGLVSVGSVAGSGGMWTDGTILDAVAAHPLSGIQYLRYDFNYDLSDYRNDSGALLGMAFLDETGTNVAGIFFHDQNGVSAPDGLTETLMAGSISLTGAVSVIMRIDTGAGKMDAWYDLTGSNSFSETNPSLSGVSVKLASVGKLRIQATGDFRPAGSDDQATIDNIRTAATWAEITAPLANVQLFAHSLFQDHMVLQRDMNVPVWGLAASGAVVTVQLDDVEVGTATADQTGRWQAWIGSHAHDGGQSHTLRISSPGERDILFSDVLFGDVYLASGQSNMYLPISGGITARAEEVAAANYPLIRYLQVRTNAVVTKLDEPIIQYGWRLCSPATVSDFSAVGYFFARSMYLNTGVPVGLLACAWGGQKIERFIAPDGLTMVPEVAGLRQNLGQGGLTGFHDIYNAMIAPLIPYGVRGAIWYQGEANSSEADFYRFKMMALVRGWRQAWGQGDFPFYYVQLSTWTTGVDWPGMRSAQRRFLSETNTGMAVTIDTGNDGAVNIHPFNKQDVGFRLAQWALKKEFNQSVVYSGPIYQRLLQEGSSIRVVFDCAEPGLITGFKASTNPVVTVSGPLENFEIAGADKVFTNATAVIEADTVVVSNSTVASPVYVRYCYAAAPSGSNKLYNAAGLPAVPFYTDEAYRLDILSGSGSATKLVPGATQLITANAPATGKVFDRWIGAASEINNPNASNATVTMPDHALYLLATYRNTNDATYVLTVNNGYGSGTSQAGSILMIEANPAPSGQVFDHWSGSTQQLVDASAPVTTLGMPTQNVTVTAVYRTIDSIGDGVPDSWRAASFGGDGTTTNSESASGADPDGDGANNLQEYLAGTAPLNGGSVFRVGLLNGAGTTVQIGFPSATGRRYRLETTDNLKDSAWVPVFYNMTGDGSWKNIVSERNGFSNRFYRVKMTPSEAQ